MLDTCKRPASILHITCIMVFLFFLFFMFFFFFLLAANFGTYALSVNFVHISPYCTSGNKKKLYKIT